MQISQSSVHQPTLWAQTHPPLGGVFIAIRIVVAEIRFKDNFHWGFPNFLHPQQPLTPPTRKTITFNLLKFTKPLWGQSLWRILCLFHILIKCINPCAGRICAYIHLHTYISVWRGLSFCHFVLVLLVSYVWLMGVALCNFLWPASQRELI